MDEDGFADDMGEQLDDVRLWNSSSWQLTKWGPTGAVSVGRATNFACAVGISGNVWCWGRTIPGC